ncbi:MAG: ABC transporter ATP-binding protein [Cyanobacteria bacterium]|nr:ABC transporter ATP-binding protein [Cyanobacteriota bacterium]
MTIEVDQLTKVYGSATAIEEVTFAVETGEILGFLGPNGAGKTTTMRIVTGYLPATRGTARVAGFDVHEQSMAVRQRIGYLPETPPLYPEMTVAGFLQFVARLKGVPAGDRVERVRHAMARCGLADRAGTAIHKLSKGYRQRVGIAQAIVHDPPAIVLDEPTVGLDPRQIIEVRKLIESLAGDHTIVLSTHILPEVSMTCSRVAIINRGRIVATNTPENLTAELVAGVGYEVEVMADEAELLAWDAIALTPTPTPDPAPSEAVPAPDPESTESKDSDSDQEPQESEPESDTPEAIAAPSNPSNLVKLSDRGAALVDQLGVIAGVASVALLQPELSHRGERPDLRRLRLRIASQPGQEPGRAIAASILGSGLGLCELRRQRASLEDVFLQLTTTEPTDHNN